MSAWPPPPVQAAAPRTSPFATRVAVAAVPTRPAAAVRPTKPRSTHPRTERRCARPSARSPMHRAWRAEAQTALNRETLRAPSGDSDGLGGRGGRCGRGLRGRWGGARRRGLPSQTSVEPEPEREQGHEGQRARERDEPQAGVAVKDADRARRPELRRECPMVSTSCDIASRPFSGSSALTRPRSPCRAPAPRDNALACASGLGCPGPRSRLPRARGQRPGRSAWARRGTTPAALGARLERRKRRAREVFEE